MVVDGLLLDLDAHPAPGDPTRRRTTTMLGVRLPVAQAVWVQEQAALSGVAVNAWLKTLVNEAFRGERLPADVRDWLTVQATQIGQPGDLRAALVEVVRHLAVRYPHGARLNNQEPDQ